MSSGRPTLLYALNDVPQKFVCEEEVVTIGRAGEMAIVLPPEIAGISRHHATIRREGSRWMIEDAGARNGTFVDRVRVTTATLLDGCTIHLGTFPIKFHQPRVLPKTVDFPKKPATSSPSVTFSDSGVGLQADVSINITNFSVTGQSSDDASSIVRTVEFDKDESDRQRSRWFGPQQAWSLELFSELGKSLQIATNLEEMLENVLNLLFQQVTAADSAVILSCDPLTDEFEPLVQRTTNPKTMELHVSRTVVHKALASRSSLLVQDVGADPQFDAVASLHGTPVVSLICAPLWQETRMLGAVYLDTRQRQQPLGQRELEIVTALARFAAIAIDLFQQRERVRLQEKQRDRLSRYIGPSVVERIVSDGDDSRMLADKEEVTVLFSDLRGFTSISERLAPQEVVELLNGIFARLTDAVFQHRGTLDKFMGDGMMAFFGAPLKFEDHARQAVLAAREMIASIEDFNVGRPPESQIGIRIGINTGPVIVGDIGSLRRRDYTVIGDVVNIASRLESSVAKPGQIVLGPDTQAALGGEFHSLPLPPVLLKGKELPIQPYLLQ